MSCEVTQLTEKNDDNQIKTSSKLRPNLYSYNSPSQNMQMITPVNNKRKAQHYITPSSQSTTY